MPRPDDRAPVDVRTTLKMIFEGEDETLPADGTSAIDGLTTKIYEAKLFLGRRVFGIRLGFALAVLLSLAVATVVTWLGVLGIR